MNTKEVKIKRCSKCGRELPISEFYKDKNTKDGLYSNCKECHSKCCQTYRQTHKEYYSQYNKEYRQTNKEHIKEYHKQYQQTNKEHISQYQNQYRNQFTGYYLYIILDKNNQIAYVGQTKNYYNRLTKHLSEDVNSTKELFDSGNWHCIKYLDVSDLVANEMELKALENILIEIYEPRLNKAKNIIRDVDNDRIFSLIATLHNMGNDWKVFRVNK